MTRARLRAAVPWERRPYRVYRRRIRKPLDCRSRLCLRDMELKVRKKKSGRRVRKMRRETVKLVRSAKALGRRSKMLLMLTTDLVAIPLALWTALTLRFGTISHPVEFSQLL